MSRNLSEKKNQIEAMAEACEFCKNTIDTLLGEGAANRIFEGRDENLFDYLDVLNYISDEVKAYGESRAK